METLYFLQHYWWAVVSLLGALLVFLLFVQGGQTLLFGTATDEEDRKALISAFGHKWEITFTTLVTFGGAAFASFPLFYSTSFGGAYWLWILILLLFVLQAVSYEFRNKVSNPTTVFNIHGSNGLSFLAKKLALIYREEASLKYDIQDQTCTFILSIRP